MLSSWDSASGNISVSGDSLSLASGVDWERLANMLRDRSPLNALADKTVDFSVMSVPGNAAHYVPRSVLVDIYGR